MEGMRGWGTSSQRMDSDSSQAEQDLLNALSHTNLKSQLHTYTRSLLLNDIFSRRKEGPPLRPGQAWSTGTGGGQQSKGVHLLQLAVDSLVVDHLHYSRYPHSESIFRSESEVSRGQLEFEDVQHVLHLKPLSEENKNRSTGRMDIRQWFDPSGPELITPSFKTPLVHVLTTLAWIASDAYHKATKGVNQATQVNSCTDGPTADQTLQMIQYQANRRREEERRDSRVLAEQNRRQKVEEELESKTQVCAVYQKRISELEQKLTDQDKAARDYRAEVDMLRKRIAEVERLKESEADRHQKEMHLMRLHAHAGGNGFICNDNASEASDHSSQLTHRLSENFKTKVEECTRLNIRLVELERQLEKQAEGEQNARRQVRGLQEDLHSEKLAAAEAKEALTTAEKDQKELHRQLNLHKEAISVQKQMLAACRSQISKMAQGHPHPSPHQHAIPSAFPYAQPNPNGFDALRYHDLHRHSSSKKRTKERERASRTVETSSVGSSASHSTPSHTPKRRHKDPQKQRRKGDWSEEGLLPTAATATATTSGTDREGPPSTQPHESILMGSANLTASLPPASSLPPTHSTSSAREALEDQDRNAVAQLQQQMADLEKRKAEEERCRREKAEARAEEEARVLRRNKEQQEEAEAERADILRQRRDQQEREEREERERQAQASAAAAAGRAEAEAREREQALVEQQAKDRAAAAAAAEAQAERDAQEAAARAEEAAAAADRRRAEEAEEEARRQELKEKREAEEQAERERREREQADQEAREAQEREEAAVEMQRAQFEREVKALLEERDDKREEMDDEYAQLLRTSLVEEREERGKLATQLLEREEEREGKQRKDIATDEQDEWGKIAADADASRPSSEPPSEPEPEQDLNSFLDAQANDSDSSGNVIFGSDSDGQVGNDYEESGSGDGW